MAFDNSRCGRAKLGGRWGLDGAWFVVEEAGRKSIRFMGEANFPLPCPTRASFFETVNNHVLLLCEGKKQKLTLVTDGCLSNFILHFSSLQTHTMGLTISGQSLLVSGSPSC